MAAPASRLRKFLYENGLLLVTGLLIVGTWTGQALTGWRSHNDNRQDLRLPPLPLSQYLHSAHLIEATFENLESEFLQAGLYVVLAIWLRQRGSPDSKKLAGTEDVDRDPDPTKTDAPWPVRRGGWWLRLYRVSLSLAFLVLFLGAVFVHVRGGAALYNLEQRQHGRPLVSHWEYLHTARFWFESFQNWQSEFVSVFLLVCLSIFLRQHASPQSKPVDEASTTGK